MDLKDGLTLAVVRNNGTFNTVAVVEDNERSILAVNISEMTGTVGDIPETYQALGYKKIAALISGINASHLSIFSYDELLSPAGTGGRHIGLGFNYPEHADEIEAQRQPFIFLKAVEPTREQNIITNADVLLDYEVEICARPLQPIVKSDNAEKKPFGFFLCGDFTDRASLMRNIDLDNMQSGAGFSDAKSLPGYFPTGPFMVIPRDEAGFMQKVSFSLYRNSRLKQQSTPSRMIWDCRDAVKQVFAAQHSERPLHSSRSGQWLANGAVSTEMVFLTGTPEGVIMQPPSALFKFVKGVQFVFSGAIFKKNLEQYVIESYIQELTGDKTFLQPGEHITMLATYMGRLEVKVRR